jgi:hypothetical protein
MRFGEARGGPMFLKRWKARAMAAAAQRLDRFFRQVQLVRHEDVGLAWKMVEAKLGYVPEIQGLSGQDGEGVRLEYRGFRYTSMQLTLSRGIASTRRVIIYGEAIGTRHSRAFECMCYLTFNPEAHCWLPNSAGVDLKGMGTQWLNFADEEAGDMALGQRAIPGKVGASAT